MNIPSVQTEITASELQQRLEDKFPALLTQLCHDDNGQFVRAWPTIREQQTHVDMWFDAGRLTCGGRPHVVGDSAFQKWVDMVSTTITEP